MNEEQFWIAIWRTVAAAFLGLVASIASCTSYTNYKIAEMTKNGADPIAAACAVRSNGQDAICVLSVQRAKP